MDSPKSVADPRGGVRDFLEVGEWDVVRVQAEDLQRQLLVGGNDTVVLGILFIMAVLSVNIAVWYGAMHWMDGGGTFVFSTRSTVLGGNGGGMLGFGYNIHISHSETKFCKNHPRTAHIANQIHSKLQNILLLQIFSRGLTLG